MRTARLVTFALLSACGTQSNSGSHANSNTESQSVEMSTKPIAGDILLVPLNCYVCNAIESETGTPYSHAVVVGNTTDNPDERFVYEAWGDIKTTPYREILARRQKNQNLFLLRAKEFQAGSAPSEATLRSVFERKFQGLPFDDEYIWSNKDQLGKDKLYCTEFVIKFINSWLKDKIKPLPMSFNKNQEFWKMYYRQFQMEPPAGKLGASPATLFNSSQMLQLGNLE